ncbi:MAG: nucleotidyltransferase family protein [Verrucomicrobia bacterium]|nr:nucleotidyltransferase family protein [Verrucomicrobiota bacterium]
MECLILAAGYATRLYPITREFPKPLLEVGGRTILDRLVDHLAGLPALRRIVLVTNHLFVPSFTAWRGRRQPSCAVPIELLDDGTTSDENRRGAVGDLHFALERARIDGDLLVLAADNLIQFPLPELAAAFQTRPASHVCVHTVHDPDRLRRTGVAVLDPHDRVVEFAEKPAAPKTSWAVPPIYLFPRATLSQVAAYVGGGGSRDAPGHFLEWLCRREPVYAYRIRGAIHDIGTPESLEAARRLFAPGPRS